MSDNSNVVGEGPYQDYGLSGLVAKLKRMEIMAIEIAHAIDRNEMASKEAMLGLLDRFMGDGESSIVQLFQLDARMAGIVER